MTQAEKLRKIADDLQNWILPLAEKHDDEEHVTTEAIWVLREIADHLGD